MYIYTITTFEKFDEKYGYPSNSRCVGYYKTFEDADKIVRKNCGDIFEWFYNYVVIEKVEVGLYPVCMERWFYSVNYENEYYKNATFKPIDEPKSVKHIINFAIG